MKRSCKDMDLTDIDTIYPWVLDCIARHRKRYDFRKMLVTLGGMSKEEYGLCLTDKQYLHEPARKIALEAIRRIENKDLDLPTVKIQKRKDRSSFKVRDIGCESPMQQIFDYIAVKAAQPIFKRRIVQQQCSSVKGRGPSYGVRMIQRWIDRDNASMECAVRKGYRYTRRCRYFVKLDVSKCYPSMRMEIFMRLFRRDCGNETLCWLWEQLLSTHRIDGYEGFMIGAWPSQWAAQYIMSFLYRYVTGLHDHRGKQLVSHCLIYMDDVLLLGSSRKGLKMAAEQLTEHARDAFKLTMKPLWHVQQTTEAPIDMMGYVIHADGRVTVRARVFLRTRRLACRIHRKGMATRQARRLVAYKGYFYQRKMDICAHIANKKYGILKIFHAAAKLIGQEDRKKCR